MTNLCYSDDTALIADNITSMKRILNRVQIAGTNASLKLNAKKTKVMHINDTNNTAKEIKVDNSNFKYVQSFKYLGSVKENNELNSSCSNDVKTRIVMAKQKSIQLTPSVPYTDRYTGSRNGPNLTIHRYIGGKYTHWKIVPYGLISLCKG